MRVRSGLACVVLLTAACGGSAGGVSTTGAAAASTDAPMTTSGPEVTSGATTTSTVAATSTVPEALPTTSEAPTTTAATDADSGCDHPYMPIREGSRWTFGARDGTSITWEVTSVGPEGDSATMDADLVGQEGIFEATVNFECDDSGLSAPELAFTGLPLGATVEHVQEDGVFLPPASELVPGATWTSVVTIVATLEDAPGFDLEILRTATYTVEGTEEVTVPAGTFTALRIRSDFALDINAGGNAIQTESVETLWFADGVGFVREAGEADGSPLSNELLEYVIP